MRFVAAVVFGGFALACGGTGVEDEQLRGLVVDPKPAAPIDVNSAVKDPSELARALASPHAAVLAALGPHAVLIETRTVVEEGGKATSDLADKAELEIGDAGAFHGVYTNSADYGREATFVGGKLYLRPRYQKWHGRAPESPDEPTQIRESYFAAIAATWDLVAPGAEITDRGTSTVAGRPGRKVAIHLAPTVREIPRETLSQRRWRETRSITALDGEITLDADKGVPLAAKLTATVTFSRDGRRFAMKLGLDAAVTRLGAQPITAPADTEVVATPTRRGEADERDYLLNGLAPPIKKNKDGTAKQPGVDPAKQPDDAAKKPDGKDLKKADGKSDSKSAPDPKRSESKKSDGTSDKKSDAKSDSRSDKKSEKKSDAKSDGKTDTKSEPKKSDGKQDPKSEPKPASAPTSEPKP
jgi:hypothetical protein